MHVGNPTTISVIQLVFEILSILPMALLLSSNIYEISREIKVLKCLEWNSGWIS